MLLLLVLIARNLDLLALVVAVRPSRENVVALPKGHLVALREAASREARVVRERNLLTVFVLTS